MLKKIEEKLQSNTFIWLTVTVFWLTVYYLFRYEGIGARINIGDSVKWSFLSLVQGTPHSTGYPLFLIILKVFSYFPTLENWEATKLVSILFGALTLSQVALLSKYLYQSTSAAYLTSALLGTTYLFWSQSTELECYTLLLFFVISTLYFFIRFLNEGSSKWFYLWAFFYAISFGNHQLVACLIPAYALGLLIYRRDVIFDAKKVAITCGAIFLGMSQYLYLYWLSHYGAADYLEFIGHKATFGHFLSYITGSQFKDSLSQSMTSQILIERLLAMFTYLLENLGKVGLTLCGLGFLVFSLKSYRSPQYIVLTLAALAFAAFSLNYNIEKGLYTLPVIMLLCLSVGNLFALSRSKILIAFVSLLVCWGIRNNFQFNRANSDLFSKNLLYKGEIKAFQNVTNLCSVVFFPVGIDDYHRNAVLAYLRLIKRSDLPDYVTQHENPLARGTACVSKTANPWVLEQNQIFLSAVRQMGGAIQDEGSFYVVKAPLSISKKI